MRRLTDLNIALSLSIFLVGTSAANAVPNPAAWYCAQLGYEYQVRTSQEGNEYGFCVFPDGSECNAWDYFRKCYYGESSASCEWPCQELACRQAGESVYLSECCEGLDEIYPAHIFDADCNETEMVGWLPICSDCGNGICEPWESKCNCPEDCRQPRIIYVDSVNGDDSDDGRTPETAYATIQAAIDAAVEDDVVVVAPGTYSGDGNRDIDFRGKAIAVRSVDPNDPNIVSATIIDCQGTEEEPYRGFYFHSCEGSDSVLEGFTITNGGYGYVNGGGIYCENSSPIITNCNIIGNMSDSFLTRAGGYAGRGGGIYCEHSNATISNCSIIGNTAGFAGGGICCFSSDPVINDCTITGNQSGFGGGLYCYKSKPRVNNCTISNNSVGANGGGVCGDYYSDSHPTINKCVISGNTAGLRGGGIASKNLTLTNSKISGNSAISWGGGAMFFCRNSTQIVHNCVISGNTARREGGIWCLGSNTKLNNCTIAGNRSGFGGCVIRYSGHVNTNPNPVISNCIFWSNRPLKGSAAIEIHSHPVYLTISYTDLQDGEQAVYVHSDGFGDPLTWGDGNSDVDPCFVEPGYWDPNGTAEDPNDDFWVDGDYHLRSQAGRWDPNSRSWVKDDVTSPCIDASNPMSPIGYEPFPNGGIVNMGAYGGTAEASKSYFGEPVCETIIAGDINGDCRVDFKDFALMAFHWLEDNNR